MKAGITCYYSPKNVIVSFNTLTQSNATGIGNGIYTYTATNCSFSNNTITMSSTAPGIQTDTSTANTIIEGNTITGTTGITINGASNTGNIIYQNNLDGCTTGIANTGTGTLTTRTTHILTIVNVFDGSGKGTYTFSNSTQRTLTSSGQININGENVTSPQTLTMSKDYFVYIMDNLVTVSDPAATPTPSPAPSVSVSTAQAQYNVFLGYVLTAFGLAGLIPLILVIVFFSKGFRNGEEGGGASGMLNGGAAPIMLILVVFTIMFLIGLMFVSTFSTITVG